MYLIGLNGLKGAGKDTAYQCIRDAFAFDGDAYVGDSHPRPYERVERRAFADALKIIGARSLGFEGGEELLIQIMDDLKAESDIVAISDNSYSHVTGRQYQQNLGSYAREVLHDTIWIDQVVPKDPKGFDHAWGTAGRNGEYVGLPRIGCITDVRYPNEAERIHSWGGEIWKIERPGLESDGHATEQPLPRHLVDLTIPNHGTIDDLRLEIARQLLRLPMSAEPVVL